MRQTIHQLHPGQVVLLWALTVLGLWAFNSRRLEPALGVEEVEALATHRLTAPPTRNADSLAKLVAVREGARSAMDDEIAADSLALIALVADLPALDVIVGLEANDRPVRRNALGRGSADDDSTARDSADTDSLPDADAVQFLLPRVSPGRHFAYAGPVVDSTWPWSRTIPSRVRQRAVNGEAERVRTELDGYVEVTQAWASGRAKVKRSLVVKGFTIVLFFIAVGVTWMWFGRPRREDVLLD